ncbi:MAG: prepilin-type N-terminal cleavage/methylation domain-containing protein [Halieaceae bacterium]|nr:prepilin-type N-terminal cleavage/methylation domain-containing protein [Halieaceae bacterium]
MSPGVPKRTQRDAGFTLIEVMVALTILSLVMVVTVTGLRTLGNTQSAITRLTDRVDEIRSVSSFLRDAFDATIVGDDLGGLTLGGNGSGSGTGFFRIEEDGSLEWRSSMLFGETYGGSFYLRLAQVDDTLILQWQEPENSEPYRWEESPSRRVIDRVEEFSVAYRRELDGDWITEWDKSFATPYQIRLRIKSSDRYWPDMIMGMGR